MDLRVYLLLARRWLWLISLLAIIGAGVSFIYTRIQPAQYQASVTIQVGSAQYSQNPNTGLIQTSEQLADTYAVIVKKYPVLQATANKLQLKTPPTDLVNYFQVQVIPNTALLQITVTYPDPIIAADMANELGNELIANSPTNLALDQQAQVKTLEAEIADAQSILDAARKDLTDTKAQIAAIQGPVPAELTTHSNDLVTQINAAQANFAQLSTTLANLQKDGSANSLEFVETARIPDKPSGLPVLSTVLLAAFAGAVIAMGIALIIEYLNDTVRSPAELSGQIGVRILGSIAPFGKRNTYADKLITWLQPRSPIAESYRALRVNLMYMEREESEPAQRMYVVTSPSPTEGKTVTTANLAVTFAATGLRVLLIDADMRRPAQHTLFGLSNLVGLSDVLSADQLRASDSAAAALKPGQSAITNDNHTTSIESTAPNVSTNSRPIPAAYDVANARIQLLGSSLIQKTDIPGLDVIASGLPPSAVNPAEMLGANHMHEFVGWLSTTGRYDIVMFDTPPILAVSDGPILATVTNAKMLLVIEAGKTRRGAALRAIQQIASLSIPLAGIVMNRMSPREADSGYSYYYGYYGQAPATNISMNGSEQPAMTAPASGNSDGRETGAP